MAFPYLLTRFVKSCWEEENRQKSQMTGGQKAAEGTSLPKSSWWAAQLPSSEAAECVSPPFCSRANVTSLCAFLDSPRKN